MPDAPTEPFIEMRGIRKSFGAPLDASNRLNASNGLDVMTPPKSHNIADMDWLKSDSCFCRGETIGGIGAWGKGLTAL